MSDEKNNIKISYKDLLKAGRLAALDRVLIGCSFMFAFLVIAALAVVFISSMKTVTAPVTLCCLAFLLIALGMVYFSLARLRNPEGAVWFLIVALPVAVVVFVLATLA